MGGGVSPRRLAAARDTVRLLVACTVGGKDKIVPPDSVRRLVKAMQELNKKDVLLIDREEGGHATTHDDTTKALEFILEQSQARRKK